jgi:hypothetical protein
MTDAATQTGWDGGQGPAAAPCRSPAFAGLLCVRRYLANLMRAAIVSSVFLFVSERIPNTLKYF